MAIGPSPRVRQEFRKYLTNTVAAEGEPAALGKSATGPVYYTDYDSVEHKNRVWFRKGANKEIVGVARADNQGLPDVPNLPIRVARRFGSNWVVDWQRENAAVPTGGGGTSDPSTHWINAKMMTQAGSSALTFDQNGKSGYEMPFWELTDSGGSIAYPQNGVIGTFPSKVAGTTWEVTVYWTSENDGDAVLEIYNPRATGDNEGFVDSTADRQRETVPLLLADTFNIHQWTVTFDVTTAAGDMCNIQVVRVDGSGSDTISGSVYIFGASVKITGGTATGGATSTASGVHKFSPAQMLAAQNASETSVNSLATPAIAIPDSGATPTINVAFLADKTSATLDIDIYAVTASGSGDVVLDADAYSGATDGTGTPTDNNGFVTDGTFAADGNIRIFPLTVAFATQPDLTPGDYCSARIQRLVASGDDTLAADLHVLMIVVTENGDG